MALCVIVDDHDDTREGFAEYLEVNGLEVLSAASAEEFESIIESRAPDAIVLDLQLPRVDGWELARRVRASPALRNVPLVAFSACVMPDERSLAEEVGFDLFLGKPCDPDTVLNEILRLMADRKHESRKNEPSA
jgi:CheY-like chemotaxis protein